MGQISVKFYAPTGSLLSGNLHADDTVRKLSATNATLKRCLEWPEKGTTEADWRANWSKAFTLTKGQVIKTSKDLAVALAALAQSIRDRANTLLATETDAGPLRQLHKAFKEALIHDLKPDDFADMYAQTIAYGLLSARISRQSGGLTTDDAALMAPQTSPFLKEMLGTFLEAGGRKSTGGGNRLDFDELGVSAVVDLLRATDMEAVLDDFGKTNPDEDPVIHFYELFLKQYDPKKRMQRGVFYTPRPVVGFIVRSVDEVLRTEFGLEDGLASTATWAEVIAASTSPLPAREGSGVGSSGEPSPARKSITLPAGAKLTDPFVRILDPATGTGTFLVECIDLIHKTMVKKWKAAGKRDAEIKALWNDYVSKHLLPRLTGFELMMAPYAIAHVKLGLKLSDTGYTFGSDARAQIYLTNALEPTQDLNMQLAFMSEALAHEAKAANEAKEMQFTVVLGNPPYAKPSEGTNETVDARGRPNFIGQLLEDYLMLNGERIRYKNSKAVKADENKFIRLAQYYICTSGVGIASFIAPHGFLDATTLRAMRWQLDREYTDISIIDLHGNSNRREGLQRGIIDENVFDILQGVAIHVFTKHTEKISGVSLHDCWGLRSEKYDWLVNNSIGSITHNRIVGGSRNWSTATSDGEISEYSVFPSLGFAMPISGNGFKSHRDEFAVAFDAGEMKSRLEDMLDRNISDSALRTRYEVNETRDWALPKARASLTTIPDPYDFIIKCLYRPFDDRYCHHSTNFMDWPRHKALDQMRNDNVGLVTTKETKDQWDAIAANKIIMHKALAAYDTNYIFSLWLKPQGTETRTLPNIAPAFANRIAALTGLAWDDCVEGAKQGALAGVIAPKPTQTAMFATRRERGAPGHSFGPRDLFDYIYAVLHSPAYRSRYADYLKSDFARIPLPGSVALFEALVPLGTRLVALHLLDATAAPDLADPRPIRFVGSGEPRVAAKMPEFKAGRVYINANCWFQDVPQRAWSFHIGGYQPAQKWLKDRAAKGGKKASDGRVLTPEDIIHYRRMITAMDATIDIMTRIDTVIDQHGGWPGAFRGMTDEVGG